MGNETAVCHLCGVQLGSYHTLLNHIQGVHLGRRFPCDVCNKAYKSKTILAKHKLVHNGAEPFACKYCPKKYAIFHYFKQHVITHSDIKNFKCDKCDKSFPLKSYLRSHVKDIHEKSYKRHTCGECGAIFSSSYRLKRHSNTHLIEKPYICQFCGKQCTQKSNLKIHIMGVHKDVSHLVYNNEKPPKVDPSIVDIPTSFKDYMKMTNDGKQESSTKKEKTTKSKKRSSKKSVKKECKNAVEKAEVDTKGKDNSICETTGSVTTVDKKEICNASGDGYDSTASSSINDSKSQINMQLNCGYVTFSKKQDLKVSSEWTETRQCRVALTHCKWEIPIKEETDASSWSNTNKCEIFIKEEAPSQDDTDDPLPPIKKYKESPQWDGGSDTEFELKNETTYSTCEDVKPISLPCEDTKECEVTKKTKSRSSTSKSNNKTHQTDAPSPKLEEELESRKHCDQVFSKEGMKSHVHMIHNVCKRCDRVFADAAALKRHCFTYCCKYCDKSFNSQLMSNEHKTEHELITQTLECDVCAKKFLTASQYNKHKSTSHGFKRFLCQQCPKVFSVRGRLNKHMVSAHSQDRPYECRYCPRKFSFFSDWKRHILLHTNEKSHLCHICSKRYPSSGGLSKHIKDVHMNIRNYKCDVCQASFPQLCKLRRHSYIHTNTKPYKCQFCSKECTQASNLKIHIMAVHRDVSHQVYKNTETVKHVDPNSIVLPKNSKQYFEIFASNTNTSSENEGLIDIEVPAKSES